MQALKFKIPITDSGRLVIKMPDGYEGDEAEVIVLMPERTDARVHREDRWAGLRASGALVTMKWESLERASGVVDLGGNAVEDCAALYDEP